MVNIWIDCEFNEFGGDLISMALVADDGQEFYEVINLEKDWKYGNWVYFNVVPWLNKDPITKQLFQQRLWTFINQWDEVHLIAVWPDDIKYFCQSLITGPGMAINTPMNMTMQIDRSLSSKSSKIPHNALEDARAIKRSWEHVHPEDENKAQECLYLEAADRIEALKAAIERTKEVPVGPTLVDQISDEDWVADASDWNINAGATRASVAESNMQNLHNDPVDVRLTEQEDTQ